MESTLREGGRQPGLILIETIYWDGRAAPRWPLHAARLRRSALSLGWAEPRPEMPKGPDHPARLRLTLNGAGELRLELHPLPPGKDLWRIGIASERLSSADPWLSVKSSNRGIHDRARAALPPGLDELIFLNERGELAEGTITSLFFDRGEGMRTPPLTSGALPGVLRAELNCPEEVLRADELPGVRGLWVGNALRGLIPAVFAAG